MKTLFAKHKWMQIVYGALLAGAGIAVIAIALNNPENITKWLSIIVAICLFLYSAALMFSAVFSLKKKIFDIAFLYVVAFIAIGVVLLTNPEMIGSFITIFVATMLCAAGVIEIGEATAMIFFKRPKFFIVLFYVLGAAFITLGVLSFSFQVEVQQVIYVASGGLFVIAGVIELFLGFVSILRKKDEAIIDAELDEKEDAPKVKDKEEETKTPELEANKKSDGADA